VRALLIGTGVFAGCAVGYVLYLLATVFPHMLHEALPNMTQAWFVALWIGALCVPILALRTVAVRGAARERGPMRSPRSR
jgi:ABC-type arginine transport system permease subunit